MKRQGLTLLETVVAVVIMIIVAGIVYPSLVKSRISAKETKSKLAMKQIYTALMVYAADWGGAGNYGSASSMGLPSETITVVNLSTQELYMSGCQFTTPGNQSKRFGFIYPPAGPTFAQEAQACESKMPLILDLTCNDRPISESNLALSKKVLAVNLAGAAVKQVNSGYWLECRFWK